MKSHYDLLVIGGGPGGALAAKTAAENGLSVCLIEKRPAIGVPLRCAEGIGEDMIHEFFDELDTKWVSAQIRQAVIVAPDNRKVVLDSAVTRKEVGYVLDRKVFDRDLIAMAAGAGAEIYVKTRAVDAIITDGVVQGARVWHDGGEQDIYASVVIAADGVESKFARWCGINSTVPMRELETCAQYLMTNIDINADETVIYLGNDIAPGGYVWIFPKGEGTANVGIGIMGSRSGEGCRARDYLDAFVREKFSEGKKMELIMGGVSVCKPLECTVADGLLIVGDAARLSDPMTGGGIYHAMYTGRLAAEVATAAIRQEDCSKACLMSYDTTWRNAALGRELARNYRMKEFFITLDDEVLNAVLNSVKNLQVTEFSVLQIIREIVKLHPDVRKELTSLIKYNSKGREELKSLIKYLQ
ncbi:NAD(P)/FAD-dependent oxidoreductase [Methanogenium cariaci]|jgi:digeranylgeranylglycerophospholipid reductase